MDITSLENDALMMSEMLAKSFHSLLVQLSVTCVSHMLYAHVKTFHLVEWEEKNERKTNTYATIEREGKETKKKRTCTEDRKGK